MEAVRLPDYVKKNHLHLVITYRAVTSSPRQIIHPRFFNHRPAIRDNSFILLTSLISVIQNEHTESFLSLDRKLGAVRGWAERWPSKHKGNHIFFFPVDYAVLITEDRRGLGLFSFFPACYLEITTQLLSMSVNEWTWTIALNIS